MNQDTTDSSLCYKLETPHGIQYRSRRNCNLGRLSANPLHRVDQQGHQCGPAWILPGVLEGWFLNGQAHRENQDGVQDGPAIYRLDGTAFEWYWKGQLHRVGGPAVKELKGKLQFYLHGERYEENDYWIKVASESTTAETEEYLRHT